MDFLDDFKMNLFSDEIFIFTPKGTLIQLPSNATALDSHLSSSLCHLGNVSYMLGTESANQVLAEAVKNDVDTKDSFARMMDHLKANEVNTDVTHTVVGPLLKIDRATEMFTGGEKVITDNANGNPLRKRIGRGPFTIPVFKV